MRIIVSDTSCLIDLRRGGLLELFLELPYEFVITFPRDVSVWYSLFTLHLNRALGNPAPLCPTSLPYPSNLTLLVGLSIMYDKGRYLRSRQMVCK